MKGNQSPNPKKLPKIRNGIDVAFNDYDLEGRPQWLIHDAGRNKFFLVGWLEYEIYQRWELRDINAIVDSINTETTLQVETRDIENFFDFLKRNYLIEMSGYEIHNQAKEQKLFKTDNLFNWLVGNYLFFRIPLVKPDAFLSKTRFIADFVFGRFMLYLMLILGAIALYQLSIRWDDFISTFPSVFTLKGLFFAFIAFLITKLGHELGHAYMCKSYGVPVPTLGVAFLVFWPVLYTDTTLSWSLNNRERLRIAFAGIWVETYLTIIALLIWCNVDNQTIKTICFISITINWVASLLINVSPFMRFDGYYILADYLKMPNLQFRAFALTRWQIRRLLFGWDEPPPEKFTPGMNRFLILYSITTWIYRLILYLGIAILIYHFFAKAIGIVLFLIEIYYFILAPIVAEIRNWIANRDNFSFNLNTKITLTISVLGILVFFIPVRHTLEFPSTLSHTHQFLYSPEAGILQTKLPPLGEKVKANQPIAEIKSVQLDQAIFETRLEYDKTVSQLRRSAVNPEFQGEKNILLSDLKKLRSEYQKLLKIKERLILKVPFDGILVEVDLNLHPGAYVMKDQWIADVIKPDSFVIEAFVSQIDINYVLIGAEGHFYSKNLSVPSIPVKVMSIEVVPVKELDCHYSTELKQQKGVETLIETPCYNATDLGGDIPAYQSDEGKYIPTTSVYRVVLSTSKDFDLSHVERGNVLLETPRQSYAYRLFYYVKSILIQELEF